jgi:hypothetical protein
MCSGKVIPQHQGKRVPQVTPSTGHECTLAVTGASHVTCSLARPPELTYRSDFEERCQLASYLVYYYKLELVEAQGSGTEHGSRKKVQHPKGEGRK